VLGAMAPAMTLAATGRLWAAVLTRLALECLPLCLRFL
jgi:hypothetical protein